MFVPLAISKFHQRSSCTVASLEDISILDICRAVMWSSINPINLYTIADASRNYAKLGILWFADYSKMLEMPLPTYLWGETDGNYCLELLTFWICIWTVIWRRKEDNLIVIGLFWDVYCKSTLTAFSTSTEILWLGQVAGPHWTVYPGLLYCIYAYWWCDLKEDYLMMVNFFFFFPHTSKLALLPWSMTCGKKSGMKSVVVMDGHTNLHK